jgi:hypothetical protein
LHTKALSIALLIAIASARPGDAAPKNAAARGLDLFLHAPKEIPSGGTLPLQVRVFGFSTVSTLAPLGGAKVEAAWDPESFGKEIASVPPPVSITCDEAGRGHLDIAVPQGKGKLNLLVAARWQGHERTRTLEIDRSGRYEIELRVSDTNVVPGASVSAWMLVRDRVTSRPASHAWVDLVLKEGSLARFSRRLTTDRAGLASSEVRVPFVDDPDWQWTLSARTTFGQGDEAEATRTLGIREETPQAPTLHAKWATASAVPGNKATFMLEVLDGTGQGIPKQPLRYWVGPKGTQAPKEDKPWLASSTELRTDVDGRADVTVETPKTISPRGSNLTVVAKTLVEANPLTAQSTLTLATPAPEVTLTPEFGVLVPGQPERLFLHATLDEKPIAAEFALEGHGLHAQVRTDVRGWGETLWNLPAEIGARASEKAPTDCVGEVTATVHVRWISTGTSHLTARPFDRCLRVDRDVVATIRPVRPLVKAGESLGVRVLGGKGSASVILEGHKGSWHSTWLADANRGGSVTVPSTALGSCSLSTAGLTAGKDRNLLGANVLVLPRLLPKLSAKLVGDDRTKPGSKVVVEAVLDDGHGKPLTGSVGAVVFDKAGGTRPGYLLTFDTRRSLASGSGVAEEDIDAFLEGDKAFDIERWAALADMPISPAVHVLNPNVTVDEQLNTAFRQIVQSLEGAVFESSRDPEKLRDVRVRTATGYAINPELLTLVTQAMSEPPLTPGGEPWLLADLMAIDPQVKFDNVARRVTRLKLFNVLSKLREHLFEKKLGLDEPALHDPNALLRRMVRDSVFETGDLLDPWGHGLTFVRSAGPRIPFLSTIPGYRLLSAGPDGRFGTPDDVQDPFQRVLASKTPYANAVEEDRIVDAKWDMRVGDETVSAWSKLLEELTGQMLGDQIGEAFGVGGLGLSGSGSGGGGTGFGYGRGSGGIDLSGTHWLPPVRTDEQGRVRLSVPLGDAETTWQVVLVAMPDDGLPAATSVDVSTSLPLSVRVNAGATWLVGDEVDVALRVRNRTDKAVSVDLRLSASGAASLVHASEAKRTFKVPAQSATTTFTRVRGAAVGTAILEASVEGAGYSDRLKHQWSVKPAGEVFVADSAVWLEQAATLPLPVATANTPAQGPGRLVLEKGIVPALASVLDSLVPERLAGERAFADALEVFGRVRTWAIIRGGETNPLAVRARQLAQQAHEREELRGNQPSSRDSQEPLRLRGRYWQTMADPPQKKESGSTQVACPSDKSPPHSTGWTSLLGRITVSKTGAGLRCAHMS